MPEAVPPRETAWLAYQALDQSDDIILLLESDGAVGTDDAVVITVNGAFRRASGYSDDRIIGRQAMELFPDGPAESLMNAIRAKTSLRGELACGRAGGGTFMFGFHLMLAPERTPGRSCFAVLGRDITAQLEARQMQNSIQRLLAKVFTSIDEAVVIISAAGRIMMANPRIDQLLGYKPNELVGRKSLDMVAPDARASIAETIKGQMKRGTDQTYVAPLLKADGSQIVATITSALVSTEDGKQFRILTLRSQAAVTGGIRIESAGRIRLVGLDEVRAVMGDRWQGVAERAMATAEAVIKRRCGPQDSYSRADDTSFLMCFGQLSEQEASFRAAMIGREVRDRLIGQGSDPDTAYVRSIAASVRFPDTGKAADSLHAVLLDGLDAQLERVEREARHTLRAALAGAVCDLGRISGRNASEAVAMQVNLPRKLERGVIAALASLPAKESGDFDLDGLLLSLAAQQAITGMARGDATPLLVNVRFDVFATRPATERYFATCRRIDQRVSGHLVMMLSALPEGLPKTRQLECVNRLRPFCRGVGYHVAELANLAAIDLSFSGTPIVSLPAHALIDQDPEKLKALLGSLHAKRARVLIHGVASERDAAWFRLNGADMISMSA
jgi:PAS domain S-box-containing protein